MPRVKRGTSHVKRRRSLLKAAKGYKWTRKSSIKQARTAVLKAGADAYKGRKEKKRDYRQLWQVRINAAIRPYGMSYSRFMDALKKNNIAIDRKVLADLAMNHPEIFKAIVEKVKPSK